MVHWFRSGWFTRLCVHAVRPVSVEAGETKRDRILATVLNGQDAIKYCVLGPFSTVSAVMEICFLAAIGRVVCLDVKQLDG
jgi:hypothetical protein